MANQNLDKQTAEFVKNLANFIKFSNQQTYSYNSVEENIRMLEYLMMDAGSQTYREVIKIKKEGLEYVVLQNESNMLPLIIRTTNGVAEVTQFKLPGANNA